MTLMYSRMLLQIHKVSRGLREFACVVSGAKTADWLKAVSKQGHRKVSRGKSITGWLAAACLAVTVAIPPLGLAQRGNFHPALQRPVSHPPAHPPQAHPQAHPPQAHPPQPHPQQQVHPQQPPHPQQTGHAGDWLRKYKDLPPAEQQRALHNDPAFQHLPPAQQQQLQQRLNHFSSLPPQQQIRMLNRMETWEHLTPEQKQHARQVFGQIKQLPPDRQRAVTTAIHDLRPMSPEQRERVINSDRFKGMFSDHERDMMRGATQVPLAPAEDETSTH